MTYFIFARNYSERLAIRRALPSDAMEVMYVDSPRHLQGMMLKEGDFIVEPQEFANGPTGQEWMDTMVGVMKRSGMIGKLVPDLSVGGLIFHRLIPDGSQGATIQNEPDLKNPAPPSWEEIEIGLMTLASAAASMKHQTVGLLGGWKSPWDKLHEQINDQLDAWELAGLEIKYETEAAEA